MRTEEIVEDIPCGKSITTKYLNEEGNVIRQDVRIEVREGLVIGSSEGEVR